MNFVTYPVWSKEQNTLIILNFIVLWLNEIPELFYCNIYMFTLQYEKLRYDIGWLQIENHVIYFECSTFLARKFGKLRSKILFICTNK